MKIFSQQRGVSVVELLVSLLISMAVIAGAVQVVGSTKKNYLDQDEVSFIQTNARFALDIITKDIRMAGYKGCAVEGSAQVANSIEIDANGFISMHGLTGYEGETNSNTFPADFKDVAWPGTDAILIRKGGAESGLAISSHNPASATIHLFTDHEYDPGTVLMIADSSCRNVGLFQVSGPNSVPANHINHNTGATVNNCTKIIKGDFECDPSCKAVECGGYGTATGEYGPGSKIMEFSSHAYFISESSVISGMPALKRQVLNTDGLPTTSSEEIAIGVEDLEILYGVDTDGDGDVDQYRKASQMDLDGGGTTTDEEWDQVLAVKLSLVFRSQYEVMPEKQKKTIAGTEYNDRYMRQVVNSTVRIRNRG